MLKENTCKKRRKRSHKCNNNKRAIEKCEDNSGGSTNCGSCNIVSAVENGRNCHSTKNSIGDIFKKTADKNGLDFLVEEREWQHSDKVGYTCHNKNINSGTHHSASSSLIGNSNAPRAAAAMAQIITAKPEETAVITYLNSMLSKAAPITTNRTLLLFREGGTIIAMNIPYSIIPRADETDAGRI
jgi:hypothetical protein